MAKKKEKSVSDEGSFGSYDEENDDGSVEDLAGRIRNDSGDEGPGSQHDDSNSGETGSEQAKPAVKKESDDKEKQAAEERKKKKRIE